MVYDRVILVPVRVMEWAGDVGYDVRTLCDTLKYANHKARHGTSSSDLPIPGDCARFNRPLLECLIDTARNINPQRLPSKEDLAAVIRSWASDFENVSPSPPIVDPSLATRAASSAFESPPTHSFSAPPAGPFGITQPVSFAAHIASSPMSQLSDLSDTYSHVSTLSLDLSPPSPPPTLSPSPPVSLPSPLPTIHFNLAACKTYPPEAHSYARPRTPDDEMDLRPLPLPDFGDRCEPPEYVQRAYSTPPAARDIVGLRGPHDGITEPLQMPYDRAVQPQFDESVGAVRSFYVVWMGFKVGIFRSPEAANEMVKGFRGNRSQRRSRWESAADLFNHCLLHGQVTDRELVTSRR